MFGSLAFVSPLVLLGLIALPLLWLLLRAVPPAPIKRRFPAVALLLGLQDEDRQADKTPWWLLVLRALAIAAAIVGFAGPILNPKAPAAASSGPMLIVLDGAWPDARDWADQIARASDLLAEAGRSGRVAAVVQLTLPPEPVVFQAPAALTGRVAALQPAPHAPDMAAWAKALPEGPFDTYWLASGLAYDDQSAFSAALQSQGSVTVFAAARSIYGLRPAGFADGKVQLSATRSIATTANELEISARGPDPAGIDRELARATLTFAAGASDATLDLALPPELRNRITRFEALGQRSAGAVSLTDDSLKRRKIAILGGGTSREGLQLLAPTHYLVQALSPVAELLDGSLTDILPANPDVIILADVAKLSQPETDAVLDWAEKGGLLLRFAGPKLAASDLSRSSEDPLMPVRLREGGRAVGGAMSWGEPKPLAPFAEGSPFHGLAVPADVAVSQQVLAQPDPDLALRVIAALEDGTPLVTRKEIGDGQVVLFHVTANAEWSTLPLSGLFVAMLERLAVSTRTAGPTAESLAGQIWQAERLLDGFGQDRDATEIAGVEGADLAVALQKGASGTIPPGVYAGNDRRISVNVVTSETVIEQAVWPAGVQVEGLDAPREQALKGWLLVAATALLAVDILAALWVSGRLLGRVAAVLAFGILTTLTAPQSQAQTAAPDDPRAIDATRGVVLAYVRTGDAKLDAVSEAGLMGLGDQLWARTSIEPEPPMGVDLETDQLEFYPFLYWPISADQPLPSARAYDKLNRFLRTGGLILFDTRDADVAGLGGATPEGRTLQFLAQGLDIPPLDVIPKDHVLTRSFYLLQDFPGRHNAPDLWVEAAAPDAELQEGMPFRKLNDGVTPVIIGGNDWASAWAIDDNGVQLFPVGRGYAGEQQREIAFRFGINVIMHVLTGNYKSDQVHVPALLERLGE